MSNDRDWERRTNNWVTAQHKSRIRKEEADKLNLHGDERREYLARKDTSGHKDGAPS